MNRQYVDIHVIQTVPPSNVNRDDTGSPKTATYGGALRARVSSQAWKRATRKHFEVTVNPNDLGVRTKRVVELIDDELKVLAPESDAVARHDAIVAVLTAAGIKLTKSRKGSDEPEESQYLIFFSRAQISDLASLAQERMGGGESVKSRVVKAITEKNSIDLALFGRMVADVPGFNVDACAQVAHAISVHAVDNEFDYYTAVDDHKVASGDEDAGAGMIGTVEFNSSTLYRYATVNVQQLATNLGSGTAVAGAVAAFIASFVKSLPTGKQNTFANRTLPDAVVITVRDDQPVNWVGAFEKPIKGEGRVSAASKALATYAKNLEAAYGDGRKGTWVVGVGAAVSDLEVLGERVSFDAAVAAASGAVSVEWE